MESKQFRTLSVCGVATGFVLEDRGFSGIADVMDHLYPGIMTMGQAAMASHASAAVSAQLPELKAFVDRFGEVSEHNWQAFAKAAEEEFGATLPVSGPLEVSNEEIHKAFAALN